MDQVNQQQSPTTPLEKVDRNLSTIFGTEPMEVTVIDDKGVVPPEVDTPEEQVDQDADYVRGNMYSLMQQGQDALRYALDLAKQSDSPRAFEVVGTLMKNLSDMNMQMMDMHDKKQKLKGKPEKQEGPSKVVNNSIVFQGSTADLNRMLSDMKKENE